MPNDAPAFFIADTPGIDFLNSIATPESGPIDSIGNGEGLLNWLRQAGLVPESWLTELSESAMPGELDGVADQARNLREWFRGFVKKHMGSPLDAGALGELSHSRVCWREMSLTIASS